MTTRKTIFIASIALLAAAAAVAQQQPSQVTNDAFSITLPAGYTAFTNQTKSADSPEGKVDTTTWVAKSSAGQAVIVAMTKMPGRIVHPEKMMGSTRDALVKSLNATVESEDKVPGDVAAEKIMFKSNSQPIFARARLIVTGNRQYQVIFIGHGDAERTTAEINTMFDSFQATAQTATVTTKTAPTTTGTTTSTTTSTTSTTVATTTATTANPKQ